MLGPGIVPLKVQTFTLSPGDISIVASSAIIVNSLWGILSLVSEYKTDCPSLVLERFIASLYAYAVGATHYSDE